MAIIVNSAENLPPGIIVGDINTFEDNGVPEDFIKQLVKHKKNNIGIEHDKYYIITTGAVLRFAYPEYVRAFMILRKLMDACYIRGYQYIMINKNV